MPVIGPEHLGTRLAVVFEPDIEPATCHALLTQTGNPVLHANGRDGLYIVGVPDGQDYYWMRRYRAIPGVHSVEIDRPWGE